VSLRRIFYAWAAENSLDPTEARFEAFEAGHARAGSPDVREALEKAAKQFEFYRDEHLTKWRDESLPAHVQSAALLKSETNYLMAKMCREALALSTPPGLEAPQTCAPFQMPLWVIFQDGRPFDYKFSRAAGFARAKELREDAPHGNWSVDERQGQISIGAPALSTPPVRDGREALEAARICILDYGDTRHGPKLLDAIRKIDAALSPPEEGANPPEGGKR